MLAVPLVPLGIGRRLKYLVPISAAGGVFIIFGIVVTFYYALNDIPPISERTYFAPVEQLPGFISTILFAMEGIGTVSVYRAKAAFSETPRPPINYI